MGKLIYLAITSLDGYIEDEGGGFDWAAPGEEVHSFINDLVQPWGTYLYGRRMYEVMSAWDHIDSGADLPPYILDFARQWEAAEKVVYSRTLENVATARTRLVPEFDPEAVAQLKAADEGDIAVGGPELAGQAIRAGLVDEYHLFVAPAIVGGGKHWLPGGVWVDLQLLEERRFGGGMVYLRYRGLSVP
jgi:dihydrofolate reductase